MPIQSLTDIHIDKALTNFSVLQANADYVADLAAPVLRVDKERDKYFTYDLSHARVEQANLAPRGEAGEVDWNVTQTTYTSREYGLRKLIADRERDVADAPLSLEFDTARFLKDKLMLDREFRVAQTMMTAGNYTNTSDPTDWDTANGTPVSDIQAAKSSVLASFGRANQLVISAETEYEIVNHSTMIDLSKYVTDLRSGLELPKKFLGLDVVIGNARYLTSNEGAADTTANVWGRHAIIHMAEKNPGLRSKTHYVTFRNLDFRTKSYRWEPKEGQYVETRYRESLNRIINVAGYLYENVTS